MPGLKVYTSNKLEILVQKLAKIVRIPDSGVSSFPLAPEIIIVQSKAMERWIYLQIAKQNGVCTNCIFPFPNTFFYDMIKKFIPDIPKTNFFAPEVMLFKIANILHDFPEETDFECLKRYIKDNKSNLKLFEISEKIADLFDQYTIFRPDYIFSWENNKEQNKKHHNWQSSLWRKIAKGNEKYHRSYLQKKLINTFNSSSFDSNKLYKRISVFGISSLPRFHLQLIEEIAKISEVNIFILNPCKEYWADIATDKYAGKLKKIYAAKISEEYLHIEKGNSILSSLGELGRSFFEYITSSEHTLIDQFEEYGCINMLSCIQSDILNLKERITSDYDYKLQCPDTSIQFHSCHSQIREIEVLHDNILSMLEEHEDIMPYEILVMAPDIEVYAPLIHAVFDNKEDNEPHIPFSISDRSIKKENAIIDSFLSILDLEKSRFEASKVMEVLEYPGIKEKFDLSESDLGIISGWLKDTQIRWGIDELHKTDLGLPQTNENTWKAGIKRLILGYSMRSNGLNKSPDMFSGILPFKEIEGSDAKILGNFLEFLEKVFELTKLLRGAKTAERWNMILSGIIDTFFIKDDAILLSMQFIRNVLADMVKNARISGYDKELEFDTIKYYLRKTIENEYSISGFITGGITFCSMLPMRSIPFKVICLLGMNNDAFPRSSYSYSFDLIATDPRAGDRSKKNDDKYLFLEALISARKIFYLSYVGQSIQDNSSIPPSVLISDLFDYIKEGFGISQDQLITSHKLQAFSPDYFNGTVKLFSYSEDNMLAACSLNESRFKNKDNICFISNRLSDPSDEWKILQIDSLSSFFANPVKYFFQKRLGIYFEEKEFVLSDKEIFDLSGLDNYLINQNLLADIQEGKSLDYCLSAYKSEGILPHKRIGEILVNESSIDVKNFIIKTEALKKDKTLFSKELDIMINSFSLTGKLINCFDYGTINSRYAVMKTKDIIKTWISHLALCADSNNKVQYCSYLICKDRQIIFKDVENSREILAELLKLYWEGLSSPLHFFPDLSFEYVKQAYANNKNTRDIIKDICDKRSDVYNQKISEDLYYKTYFVNKEPLEIFNDSFIKISESVIAPILKHLSEF